MYASYKSSPVGQASLPSQVLQVPRFKRPILDRLFSGWTATKRQISLRMAAVPYLSSHFRFLIVAHMRASHMVTAL